MGGDAKTGYDGASLADPVWKVSGKEPVPSKPLKSTYSWYLLNFRQRVSSMFAALNAKGLPSHGIVDKTMDSLQ